MTTARQIAIAETGSTNDEMARLAAAGEPEGSWFRADRQTGGRGRHGRSWASDPGNLYASTIVRLRETDGSPPSLTLVAAVALEQVLSARLGEGRAMIKWPNDLLVEGAKIAGILLEREGDAVVVGFGVNLAHAPDGLGRAVTSLAGQTGQAVPPAEFLPDLAESFRYWLGRWRGGGRTDPVRARWMERAHPLGTALRVRAGDSVMLEGLFDGVDAMGALRLRLADGSARVIHAGDVTLA